jgi:hypothetical protein
MYIPGILTGLQMLRQLTSGGRQTEPPAAATEDRSNRASSPPATSLSAAIATASIPPYDLRNISPAELLELAAALHDAGALSEAEFNDLTLLRAELDRRLYDGGQSVDLFEFVSRQAASQDDSPARRAATGQGIDPGLLQRQWALLQRLQRAAADRSGFSAFV